jgi:hypothetical protein
MWEDYAGMIWRLPPRLRHGGPQSLANVQDIIMSSLTADAAPEALIEALFPKGHRRVYDHTAAIFQPNDDAERAWLAHMVVKASEGTSPMAMTPESELLATAAAMRDVVEASGSGEDDLDEINAAEALNAS